LEPIRDGAEFSLYRGRQRGNPTPVLVLASRAEKALSQRLRLEHEHALAAELEPSGRPSHWRSRVTKDGPSLFSPTQAVSLSTTSNSRCDCHQTASEASKAKPAARAKARFSQLARADFHGGITSPFGCAPA
jgi:hypothetical protein